MSAQHTPQTGEQVAEEIGPALAAFVQKAEPAIRKVSERIYEELLYSVQDYLRENAEWNLGAEIDRCRAIEHDNVELRLRNKELLEALEGLLSLAEDVEAKALVGDEGCLWPVEIARFAIAKARGQ